MVPRFDSASISPLDQSHDDTNEEKHLSLLHTAERKSRLLSGAFTITDRVHSFMSEFIPCKVEALVSQKTQRELQTREQEEVAEINQAQHSKFLHSCKDIFTSYQWVKVQSCKWIKWVYASASQAIPAGYEQVLTFFCRWIFYPGDS